MSVEIRLQDWLDGRLSDADRKAFEKELAADPEKARAAERLNELNDSLKRLHEEIVDEKVPDRLRDIVRRGPHAPAEEC